MRQLFCLLAFCLFLGPVLAQPTCNGRSATQGQCEGGKAPPGYYQAKTCQGRLDKGVHDCLNAIAFSIDSWACTEPQPNKNNQYVTYCVDDVSRLAECTHKRACVAKPKTDQNTGENYTFCEEPVPPQVDVAREYPKKTLAAPDGGCITANVLPGN